MRRNHTKYWVKRLKPDEKEKLDREVREYYEWMLRIARHHPTYMSSAAQRDKSAAYYTYLRAKDLVKNRRKYKNETGQYQVNKLKLRLFRDTIWED